MEAIVHQFYEAVRTGNNDQLDKIIHEDFALVCPTREHVLSGVYQGKSRFFDSVLPHVFGCVDSPDIEFCQTFRILCSSGNVVVALALNDGIARQGEAAYNQVYVHVFRIVAGQVMALIELFDTALANRTLWGNVENLDADEPFSLAALASLGFSG